MDTNFADLPNDPMLSGNQHDDSWSDESAETIVVFPRYSTKK